MYLFIFESIGTSELLLIGVVALMFLGPRKMPEMAKKIGKIMADFRNTTSEFKETWEREVNFDEEVKSLNLNQLEAEPIARTPSQPEGKVLDEVVTPVIKEIDLKSFNLPLAPIISSDLEPNDPNSIEHESTEPADELNDKKNWL